MVDFGDWNDLEKFVYSSWRVKLLDVFKIPDNQSFLTNVCLNFNFYRLNIL